MIRTYPILPLPEAKAYEASVLKGDPLKIETAVKNAGQAVGKKLLGDFLEIHQWPESSRVLVLAGKGLNTADALVACKVLVEALGHLSVTVIRCSPPEEWIPLVQAVAGELEEALEQPITWLDPDTYLEAPGGPFEVVLDGLHGQGFHPPLTDINASVLKHLNERTDLDLRVAIDLPSGVGETSDPNAFKADTTYVLGVAKEPSFSRENTDFLGRVRFLEMEPFLDQPYKEDQVSFVASPRSFKSLNKLRSAHTDKRDFGHCLVLAGSTQMPGAALMATMACLKAGAGLVTTFTPVPVASQISARVPEAMWRPLPLTFHGGLNVETVRMVSKVADKAQAMLIGPGLILDRTTLFTVCRVIRETPIPVVLDASVLTQDTLAAVLGRPLTAGPVILTPHSGEFVRMHGLKEIQDYVEDLINLSQKYRTVTVLKGSPTYISDGERLVVMPAGGPVLARGGAGDILSGMMTTLLAQNPENPMDVAIAATSWHGAAGDLLAQERGAIGVQTTEILPHLANSLRT